MPGPGKKSELMYETIRAAGGTIPIRDLLSAVWPESDPTAPRTWRKAYHLCRHLRDKEGLEIWVLRDVALLGAENYVKHVRRSRVNARGTTAAAGGR